MDTKSLNNLIILFTKAPERGFGKSRLSAFLNEDQRYELCLKLINDNLRLIKKIECDYVIYYAGSKSNLDFISGRKGKQTGSGLGEKMYNAFDAELINYDKVILFGSDIYNLDEGKICRAFTELNYNDVVISPALDGGYGLVGMKKPNDIFSDIEYSNESVLDNTILKIKSENLSHCILEQLDDIDNFEDLIRAEFLSDKIETVGVGEYNLNYLVDDKVVRINLASQMELGLNQIPYEYGALKILEKTGITPLVFECKERGNFLPLPYLTMQFLEGSALDYDRDILSAAKSLATIHSVKLDKIEKRHFIKADKPFLEMYKEFVKMYSYYQNWDESDSRVIKFIDNYFRLVENFDLEAPILRESLINTELNNRNFIVGEDKVYIIDWEKPVIGEAEQDLAHFIVPTTTNWKTDKILSHEERKIFIDEYKKYAPVDENKLYQYEIFNCLRGLTWCSMARVEYSKDRGIKNEDTFNKINYFLSEEFFEIIIKYLNLENFNTASKSLNPLYRRGMN